jgi:hypothetical protein
MKLSSKALNALSALELLAKEAAAKRKPMPMPKSSVPAVPKPAKPQPKPQPAKPQVKPRSLFDTKMSPETRHALLQAEANVAAGSAPCLLTREQFGPGPSEYTLRCGRYTRDRL